jgi:hypothetical protein
VTPEVNELREAVHDLWACIAVNEIDHLQPETIEVARRIHEELCHSDEEVDADA